MNWYSRYPADYRADTQDLSLAEHGAYSLLLDAYYASDGCLPADVDRLCRICSASSDEERRAVETVATRFFAADDGGTRHNRRADEEIAKAASISAARRVAGTRGGTSKREANRKQTGSNCLAIATANATAIATGLLGKTPGKRQAKTKQLLTHLTSHISQEDQRVHRRRLGAAAEAPDGRLGRPDMKKSSGREAGDGITMRGELRTVRLADEELAKIRAAHGEAATDAAIEILDEWLAKPTTSAKARAARSHYAYFKASSWVWERVAVAGPRARPQRDGTAAQQQERDQRQEREQRFRREWARARADVVERIRRARESGEEGAVAQAMRAARDAYRDLPALDGQDAVAAGIEEERYWRELRAKQQEQRDTHSGGEGQAT